MEVVALAAATCFALCIPDSGARAEPPEPHLVPRIFLEPRERGVLPPGTAIRKVIDKGIQLTASMEGFRGRLYDDPAGFCTIGFGHLVKLARCDGREPARFLRGLSRAEATNLLRNDMELAEIAVMTLTEVHLTDGQYASLCDFVFNVGRGRFASSTLRKYVNAGQYGNVPAQFRRYVLANGRKLQGLVGRREKEIDLFFEDMVIPRGVPDPNEDLTPIDIARFD